MTREELLSRISIDPNVCFGKPCVRGHRVWVSLVLDLLASGASAEEILKEYPGLQVEDVRACLAWGAEMSRERFHRAFPAFDENLGRSSLSLAGMLSRRWSAWRWARPARRPARSATRSPGARPRGLPDARRHPIGRRDTQRLAAGLRPLPRPLRRAHGNGPRRRTKPCSPPGIDW